MSSQRENDGTLTREIVNESSRSFKLLTMRSQVYTAYQTTNTLKSKKYVRKNIENTYKNMFTSFIVITLITIGNVCSFAIRAMSNFFRYGVNYTKLNYVLNY